MADDSETALRTPLHAAVRAFLRPPSWLFIGVEAMAEEVAPGDTTVRVALRVRPLSQKDCVHLHLDFHKLY